MDLILSWIAGPVALLIAATGLSLLVERLTGLDAPWGVRPALGLATAIVLAQIGTAADATAELTVPALIALAVLGLVLGRGLVDRPTGWHLATAAAAFFVFAAPFLVSGRVTWTGYVKLDDTAVWLAAADHVFDFGRATGHLTPSTYSEVVQSYLDFGYPTGSLTPMALMSGLVGEDLAWTFQPAMAVAAVALSLLIFELVRPIVRGRGATAGIAVFGSLSSMLLGYYLSDGVKEVVAAPLIALGPALAALGFKSARPRAVWVPLAISSLAVVAVLGAGGAAWLVPTLVPAVALMLRSRGARPALPGPLPLAALAIALVAVVVVLAAPTGVLDPFDAVLTSDSNLGNLREPLSIFHLAGIWPALDLRSDPSRLPAVITLDVACLVLALGAVVACLRMARAGDRAGLPFACYAGGGAVGFALIGFVGSPWVDAKAMAMISPAVLAAALLAIVLIRQRTEFRVEVAAVSVVFAGAIAWAAFLAYQGTWFAPQDHYRELQRLADRFPDAGPALVADADIYESRYFLRDLDAAGATDFKSRPVLLQGARRSQDQSYVNLDEIQDDQFAPYRSIVVRRGPAGSRPPAGFRLAYSGRFYELWQRDPAQAGSVSFDHLRLGTPVDPGAVPNCDALRSLAAEGGPNGRLVAAKVGDPLAVEFSPSGLPAGWTIPDRYIVRPTGSGKLTARRVVVPAAGDYELWLSGVASGELELSIDGSRVASERGLFNLTGAFEPLVKVPLTAGPHTVSLDYHGRDLMPGSAPAPYSIGPLVLEPAAAGDRGTVSVADKQYSRLCNRRWDWVEAFA